MNELDQLYCTSFWSKRLSPEELRKYHVKFIEEASKSAIKKIPCQLNISYGSLEREKYDIFGTDLSDDAPILIYIHGGYWQNKMVQRESYEFIAKNLYKNNIKSIFIGYELCPVVTVPEIVSQIEVAAKKCIKYAKEKGTKGLFFMGHSAGAQLIASLFSDFIKHVSLEDQSLVKAAILISGVFNLLPIQKTVINKPLKMDEEVALRMSPLKQNLSNGTGTEFYSIVGSNESPEFIKQSKEFNDKLSDLGFQTRFFIIENVDHFDIVELLSEEDYSLSKLLVSIINND